jgi:hypothetical protein
MSHNVVIEIKFYPQFKRNCKLKEQLGPIIFKDFEITIGENWAFKVSETKLDLPILQIIFYEQSLLIYKGKMSLIKF